MGKVIGNCWGIPVALLVLLIIQQAALVDSTTCGIRRLSPMGLVTKGIKAEPGDWPWHVALFARGKKANHEYKCGGSIISENFVLSAAHCIQEPNPEQYFLKAGLYHLYNDSDPNIKIYNLFEIILHPKYDSRKFYNDIALMRPDRPISFASLVIAPICLWSSHSTTLIDVLSQPGTAVGFGFDETHRVSETLQQAAMKVIEKQKCVQQMPEHVRFLPQDAGKLCAIGTEAGANVCSGDSGGGLFFAKDKVWYLRGIVSAAARLDLDNGESTCDAALPATYTDVAHYTSWIEAHQRLVDQRNLLKLEDCGMARNSDIADEMQKPIFNQYPWNVLLEFRQLEKSQIHLVCSGVLVHPRYVLTVAHCVDGIFSTYNLKSVRLGEYNIRTLEDSNDTEPATTYQSVNIGQIHFHPKYNQPRYSNNLALLQLIHDADIIKPNIKPICLPSIDDYKESSLTLSGWKRNKYLFPKLERDAMNLTSTDSCRSAYEKIGVHLPASEDVLCTVYKARAKGHCHNYATGSPLQYIKRVDKVPRYFLAGMMMFNFPYCRPEGNEMFVNLDSASNWIKETVK